MRVKGKISYWTDDKGYGFIQPLLHSERVFVHKKHIQSRKRAPNVGDIVTYSTQLDNKGRHQAINVTFAGEKLIVKAAKQSKRWPLIFVVVFFVLLLLAWLFIGFSFYILVVYWVLSMITFLAYALDKKKAQQGGWRTPESTLQGLALMGGWPGALLAQNLLRHKSKKMAFLGVFWCAVLLNVSALVWCVNHNFL